MRLRTFDYRNAELVLKARYRLKSEIEGILTALDPVNSNGVGGNGHDTLHRLIQRSFAQRGWNAEFPLDLLSGRQCRFDLCKQGIAIEIEFSNRHMLYRDYFRFMTAEALGILQVGVIVLLDTHFAHAQSSRAHNGAPRLEDVVEDLSPSVGGSLSPSGSSLSVERARSVRQPRSMAFVQPPASC